VGRDPAAFRDADVQAVYGSAPSCLLNGTCLHLEKHHILGRDGDRGIRLDSTLREVLSSVFNLAVIEHSFHAGGLRDHVFARALLLDVASRKVMLAVVKGEYTVTELDRDFLALSDDWRRRNGLL